MKLATKFGILTVLLTITGGAHATCNLTADMAAVSVQQNQGQGSFTCSTVSLSDGTQAIDLLAAGKILVTTDSGGSKVLNWEIQGADPGKTYPMALVRVKNNGEGASCNYTYDGITTEDSGLGNTAAGPVQTTSGSGTFFCGSLTQVFLPVEEQQAVLPTTTAGVDCIGSISDLTLDEGSIVVAESLDGETVAACSSSVDSGQAYCEDRCVNPPAEPRGESTACLDSVIAATGEFDLELCKPCDTALDLINDNDPLTNPPLHPNDDSPNAGLPMEFCWEKTGSAYSGAGDLSHPDPGNPPQINGQDRTPGTMLKHTAIRQSETSITWFNYCYKTTVTVNGRDYTVTTCR